jgi:hypothetical protein
MVGVLLGSIVFPAHAQETEEDCQCEEAVDPFAPFVLTRLAEPIVLDGVVTHEEWGAVAPLPLVQYWPDHGGPISQRTEIYVAYDDEYLYAAARFWDSDPDAINRNSLYRDFWNGDDVFDLVIDGFNDGQTGMIFSTAATGAQQDLEVLNNAERIGGTEPVNEAWNTFWDAETRVTDEGWFAEVRIPLSSLRFREEDGRVVMGLIASRLIARSNERLTFPNIAPELADASIKPSLAQDVVLEGVSSFRPAYATPYLLTGGDRARRPGAQGLGTDRTLEAGGELKYGLTEGLTLDLTANTDFAQVESDAVEVNLDRFNLFFPEKRQFFQERSSIFEFIHGDEGRLFHSRRIGLDDTGRPLRILGGARLAGRAGGWDVGLLDMQIAGTDGAVGENDGVLRFKRGILGNGSTVGGMVTTRFRRDGRTALAVGADASFRLFESDDLMLQLAQSEDSEASEQFVDRTMARMFWRRSTESGLGYYVDAVYSGSDYAPPLGFEERDAFVSLKGRLQWSWMPEGGPFARHQTFFTLRRFTRVQDGSLESALVRFRWMGSFRRGGVYNVAFNNVWEDLADALHLPGGVVVPAGRYFEQDIFMNLHLGNANAFSGQAIGSIENFFDGYTAWLQLQPSWAISSHLTVGGDFKRQHVWFPSRDQSFDADIYRFRVQAALDRKLSAQTFLQYSRLSDRVTMNARLRYRFSEGRDLYVVYDQLRDLEHEPNGLEGLGLADQRLLIKYVYTFH